jgi:hypothetical protein
MNYEFPIPEPFLFNPIKHHMGFLREFATAGIENESEIILKQLRHIGTSVMDIYTGDLSLQDICLEFKAFLQKDGLTTFEKFSLITGINRSDFRIITLSDDSQWTMKFNSNIRRFVHFFPARYSNNTIRIKSNTLKSALLYIILKGKDLVTSDDLNKVRSKIGLSPIRNPADVRSITQMIDLLRV